MQTIATKNAADEIDELRERISYLERLLQTRDWDVQIPGLTLVQTRILRLLAENPVVSYDRILHTQHGWDALNGAGSTHGIQCQMSVIRSVLPERLAMTIRNVHSRGYRSTDRDALKKYLENAI